MQLKKHLYLFRYDNTETELAQLETRYIFDEAHQNKLLFSDLEISPTDSAFIKSRLDILSFSENYTTLISNIEKQKICNEGFKVEYKVFDGDPTSYADRLGKLKDIGYQIEGTPDYYNPTTTYAICYHDHIWIFGELIKNKSDWLKHNKKPYSYSNSININFAKALVNIAAKSNKESKLLDACCGVGTIMLEACYAGYDIEGCDINWKICKNARTNLAHFDYRATVIRADIKDITKKYDAAIIDLPYNLMSTATETDTAHIILSAAAIADRLVIVSTLDISDSIQQTGFTLSNFCVVHKKGKTSFARKIWVCEKLSTN